MAVARNVNVEDKEWTSEGCLVYSSSKTHWEVVIKDQRVEALGKEGIFATRAISRVRQGHAQNTWSAYGG